MTAAPTSAPFITGVDPAGNALDLHHRCTT
jgi:hypothetical protein